VALDHAVSRSLAGPGQRAAAFALVALLVAEGAWLVGATALRIGTPFQLNYVERFNADDATRLARG
jgi:hypothetical protein